jgi:hypothetical protein
MSWRSRRRADRPPQRLGEPPGQAGGSAGLPGWCNSESGPDASTDETPRLSSPPGDFGGESGKLTQNMIFDRLTPALKAPQQAALRQVLADLSGPAEPGDLAVEAAVLARFRNRVPPAALPGPAPRMARWRRFAAHSRRLAAGLAAAAVVAGGAAAAYAGALPGPLQNFAHRVIDAPVARSPSGQQPGGVPHQRPGTTPARATSPGRAPHSAPPGPAHAHTQPGSDAHPSRPAHSSRPRPSANSSPHPARSSHPMPPQASQPARSSRPAQSGRSSRSSRMPQPGHGPQQSPSPHVTRSPASEAATPRQAASPGPHSHPGVLPHVPQARHLRTRPGN